MGRKIPGKKHRGIKNPEKQRAKRFAELESYMNTLPKNVDEQAIPKSLKRLIKLKEAAKISNGIVKRKRKKRNALICVGQQHCKSNHPETKLEKATPVFQQRPGESGKQFLYRVSRDTHDFLKQIAFEKKYGIQIERDFNTGEIRGLIKCKREKNDIEISTADKNINKKKKITENFKSLTKNKQKLKLYMKKQNKLKNHDEFERLQDKVAFDEIAHEPPKLKIKKKMNEDVKPKNLLLNLFLKSSKEVFSTKNINQSRKKKHLPDAERRQLEKQQAEIIAVYRQLKSQRLANGNC
ncbi:hypothetical protein P5V15_002507 [Pogonomyrmex californicus]